MWLFLLYINLILTLLLFTIRWMRRRHEAIDDHHRNAEREHSEAMRLLRKFYYEYKNS